MPIKTVLRFTRTLLCAAAVLSLPVQAQFSVSAGADYSSGKFGGSTATDVWNVPIAGRWDTGPLTLKLTVPWIRISNAGGVIPVLGNGAGEHGGAGSEDRGGARGGSGSGSSSIGGSGSGSGSGGSGSTVGQFGCAFDNRKGATKVEDNGPCAGFTTGAGGALAAPAGSSCPPPARRAGSVQARPILQCNWTPTATFSAQRFLAPWVTNGWATRMA